MAQGTSGRIVLEIDPREKRDLYDALSRDGRTLKAWFLEQARQYLQNRDQLQLFRNSAAGKPWTDTSST